MKRCPYCGEKLRQYDYGGYMEPTEYGKVCKNYKCGKYGEEYNMYDGLILNCGKWTYTQSEEKNNIESAELEFEKRTKYQLKRINKRKRKKVIK